MNIENSINPFDDLYGADEVKKYFGLDSITSARAILEVMYWEFIVRILSERGHISLEPIQDSIYQWALKYAKCIKYDNLLRHIQTTHHEIKALEYTLRDRFMDENFKATEFIHFGLTSQDIVDPVYTLAIRNFTKIELLPAIKCVLSCFKTFADDNEDSAFPARTHGQLAVPTTMNREFGVYLYRLNNAISDLTISNNSLKVKFGGAVGTLAVHAFVDPDFNWNEKLRRMFMTELDIDVHRYTTQVNGNDDKARVFANLIIINNILIDFCQDIWLYFSYEYLTIKRDASHVGSSTMAQKNNPIEFENVEGTLQFVNSELHFMMDKLTRSRGQRDLSDSVVQRYYGLMFSKMLYSYRKLSKAISKLELKALSAKLDITENMQIYAELMQSICKLKGEDKFEEIKYNFSNRKLNISNFFEIVDKVAPEYKERIQKHII